MTREEEWLVADEIVGLDADLLTITDHIVVGGGTEHWLAVGLA